MASRSSRSSVKESPATGSKPRAPSPLSPTKVSRTEEKRTLISLNKRLSDYIAKVRSLENENDKLQQQITIIEETNSSEVISVKNMYDKELRSVSKSHLIFMSMLVLFKLRNLENLEFWILYIVYPFYPLTTPDFI